MKVPIAVLAAMASIAKAQQTMWGQCKCAT